MLGTTDVPLTLKERLATPAELDTCQVTSTLSEVSRTPSLSLPCCPSVTIILAITGGPLGMGAAATSKGCSYLA